VKNPSGKANETKSNISEIPVTISGLTIGIFITFNDKLLLKFLILLIVSAAKVPMIVAKIDAIVATSKVFNKDTSKMSCSNSDEYHLNEKPVNLARVFPSLKENKIITKIGEYRNINIIAK